MHNATASLASRAPGSLNSRGAKAAFYVLHVLPEWLALAVLFGCNVRRVFGTGVAGDLRTRDDTPKQRERRERREEEARERKARRAREREAGKGGVPLRPVGPLEVV